MKEQTRAVHLSPHAAGTRADIVDVQCFSVIIRVAELAVGSLAETASHAHATELSDLLAPEIDGVLVAFVVSLLARFVSFVVGRLVAAIQIPEVVHHAAIQVVLMP